MPIPPSPAAPPPAAPCAAPYPTAPETVQQITRAYLDECSAPGSRLRTLMEQVDVPPDRLAAWRPLARPLFADRAELRAFGDDLVAVFGLLTDLPRRCFDGDLGRFCAALGVDDRRAGLIRRLGDDPPPMYGRSDMYHDGTAYRLLELNLGSPVGLLDLAGALPAALLRLPAFAGFAAAHGLHPHDTGADIARTLRAAARAVSDDPRVAILEGPGGLRTYRQQRQALADQLAGRGLRAVVGEIGDVTLRAGKPHVHGTPVDLVLRYFAMEEMLRHPDADGLLDPVFRAHRDRTAVLFTPMSSTLFGNKGALAMLSRAAGDGTVLTPAERALVDRVVPWTRMLGGVGGGVGGGTGAGGGAHPALLEECVGRREELVLKPTGLFGGQGVLVGRETGEQVWRRAVHDGAAAGCLVQQRVAPGTEPVVDPRTGEPQDWQALWGAYLTPDGFAGAAGRAVPPGTSTVISLGANPGTRSACVFLR